MKKNVVLMMFVTLFAAVLAGLEGCGKRDSILVSTQELWFGLDAGTLELVITSNCKWTVYKNEEADWYTISQTEGEKDATLVITVEALDDADFRGASFVIISPGGHIRRTIFVSQNKLDFDGMINKVFGVMSLEHWNTDYYNQMIEETYIHRIYNPYDTTTGYLMYFLEDGKGVQRDHHNDTAVYYEFTYEYNPVNQILHIEFETINDEMEEYDAHVLTASDSLYRFIHEYKSHWWERADMRKISVYDPGEKDVLRQKAVKRKERGPIFMP
jgi:hypothetical protein